MMLSFLFTAPAEAQFTQGSYSTSYSGSCSAQWTDAEGSHTTPLQVYPGSAGSGATAFAPFSMNVSGDIIGTLTWNSGTMPTPQTVIVAQTATAQDNGAGDPSPSGSVNDGLGDPTLTSNQVYPGGYNDIALTSGYLAANSTGTITHYSALPWSATITKTCSPTASFSGGGPDASGGAGVSYSVTASPVTINPQGALLDQNGNYDILGGQQIAPTLQGIPAGCTVTSYSWTVSGTTFQSWTINDKTLFGYVIQSQNSATLISGSGNLTIANPSWFWDDPGNGSFTTETVSCSATVTPIDTPNEAFQVFVIQNINVYAPYFYLEQPVLGTSGYTYGTDNTPIGLVTNKIGGQSSGFAVNGYVGTPLIFSEEGAGASAWLQLCSLDRVKTDFYAAGYLPIVTDTNGFVLDSAFPYNEDINAGPNTPGLPIPSSINPRTGFPIPIGFTDSPSSDFTLLSIFGVTIRDITISDVINDQWDLFLMYQPPSDNGLPVFWIPLHVHFWGWNASATRSDINVPWPLSPSGSVYSFGELNNPPYPE